MSPRQEIADLLGQWLRLTHAESGAINSASWDTLCRIHAAKTALRENLNRADARLRAETPGEPSCGAQHPFRLELAHLISLETRNGELLAAQVRRARAESLSLNEATRNLRKVQRSYTVTVGATPGWNTYS